MSLSAANIVIGILVIMGSLLIAVRLKKRRAQVLACVLGIALAGTIAFFPSILYLLNSQRTPSDAEILSLLYGDEIVIQESRDGETVYIVEQLSDVKKEQFSYAAQVNTQVVYQENGWDNNPQSLIVLTRTGPPDCCDRSLLPILGAAVITWEDDTWLVTSGLKWITPFHSFDPFLEGEIVEIGPQITGLILQEMTRSNRRTQTWDLILSEANGRLTLVAKIETSAHNADQCSPALEDEPCWEYESVYELVPGSHPAYYDIHIIASGTKFSNGLVTPFEETSKLVFFNDKYQVEGK